MRKLIYILLWLLIFACVPNKRDASKKIMQSTKKTGLTERFDKQILPLKKMHEEQLKDSINQTDLNDLARQKIEQFFEMVNLLKQKHQTKDFKAYTAQYAEKLWLNPQAYKKFQSKPLIQSADSLKLTAIHLKHLKKTSRQETLGSYLISYYIFQKGKAHLFTTGAQIYFEIIDLDLDGHQYQTIKAKIFKIN